jgi:hypothetical protein
MVATPLDVAETHFAADGNRKSNGATFKIKIK